MKPDYAKATAELMERLRLKVSATPLPPPAETPPSADARLGNVFINAPRDCVFNITHAAPPPQRPAESS